jgi:4-hydroxybenzoate polyprenyltransferase
VLIALAATTASYQTLIFMQKDHESSLIILPLIFFASLAIYNTPKFSKDRLNRNKAFIFFASLLFAFAGFLIMKGPVQKLLVISFIGSMLYIMPFYFRSKPLKGMRNIFLIKNIFLAFFWAVVTVSVPLAIVDMEPDTAVTFSLFLRRFLFVFSITILFDIRDMNSDRDRNHNTIPVVLGLRMSKVAGYVALLCFAVLTGFTEYYSWIGMNQVYALLISVIPVAVMLYFAKPGANFLFYDVGADSLLIVQTVILVMFTIGI